MRTVEHKQCVSVVIKSNNMDKFKTSRTEYACVCVEQKIVV